VNVVFIFLSTFIAVFALGFQSQNVNQGHYWAAALTSVAIGASSIVLYKLMPDSSATEILGYLVGGVTGITASMWVHRKTLGKKHALMNQVAQYEEADRIRQHLRGEDVH
jgi:hypothetical protein